jgi:putative ABC transport system substrate-binding protein
MRRFGWVEGENLTYDFRFANGDASLYKGFAQELVRAKFDLIAAMNTGAATAAKIASSEIPIVFVAEAPVENGLVKSLRSPGGNATGVSLMLGALVGKRIQILTQAVNGIKRLAYLGVGEQRTIDVARTAATALGVSLMPIDALPNGVSFELPQAIAQGAGADAWLVDDYAAFYSQRSQIFELIAAQRKPAMYTVPYWVKEGGLLAYAQDTVALFSSAAGHVDRILRGAKPSDLPVEEPTKFVFAVNLQTARALGITIPGSVLLQANEIIQ